MFVGAVEASLRATLRSTETFSPQHIIAAAAPLVPLVANIRCDTILACLAECRADSEEMLPKIRLSALCCATVLITEDAQQMKEDTKLQEALRMVCERLWQILSTRPAILDVDLFKPLLDCAGLCTAMLIRSLPSIAQHLFDAAVEGLTVGTGSFSFESAVAVLASLSQQLSASDGFYHTALCPARLNASGRSSQELLPCEHGCLKYEDDEKSAVLLVQASLTCLSRPGVECVEPHVGSALGKQQQGVQTRAEAAIPVVTRRILLPILREFPNLRTQFSRNTLSLAKELVSRGNRSEAIHLIAALFDFLTTDMTGSSQDIQTDLRHQPFFWEMLLSTLGTASLVDEGVGAAKLLSLHLQGIYLLKRAVAKTQKDLLPANFDPSLDPSKIVPVKESAKKGKKKKDVSAAASVHSDPSPPAQEPVDLTMAKFHEVFDWSANPAATARMWNTFFLLFDALSEYGAHLVTPALQRLPELREGTGNESGVCLSPLWIEILLEKAVLHPNGGVRRIALKGIWEGVFSFGPSVRESEKPATLSLSFFCKTAFAAACDHRLMMEGDRVVLPGSFLDCKASDGGINLSALPPIAPSVFAMTNFFLQLFKFLSVDLQRKAALFMLKASSRGLGFSMLITTLLATLRGDEREESPNRRRVLGLEAVAAIGQFIPTIISQYPTWLEGRLLAGIADLLLEGCDADTLVSDEFLQVFSLLGKGGSSGGSSQSFIDTSCVAGATGSSLSHKYLNLRLTSAAARFPEVKRLLEFRTKQFGAFAASFPQSVKQRLIEGSFLSEAKVSTSILELGSPLLSPILDKIINEIRTFSSRPYMKIEEQVATLTLFAELAATIEWSNPDQCPIGWDKFFNGTGAELWHSLSNLALQLLSIAATSILRCDKEPTADFGDAQWIPMHTNVWDVFCAAAHQLLLRAPAEMWEPLQIVEYLDRVFQLSCRLQQLKVSSPSGDGQQSEYGRFILLRNSLRLFDAIISSTVDCEATLAETTDATPKRYFGTSSTQLQNVSSLLQALLRLKPAKLAAPDQQCSVTSHSWGTIASQTYRAIWQAVFVFTVVLDGCEAYTTLLDSVAERAADELDCSGGSSLSSIFDLAAWAIRRPTENGRATAFCIKAMSQRACEGFRREMFRCLASLCLSLPYAVGAPEVADQIAMNMIVSAGKGDGTDRALYFLSEAYSAALLMPSTPEAQDAAWKRFEPILLQIALFGATATDDDELEACLAALEPCLGQGKRWDQLRRSLLPSVRILSVARCAAASAILGHCERRRTAAAPLIAKLIDMNKKDPVMSHQPCMPNSIHHRSRLRSWQIMCALAPVITENGEWPGILNAVVKDANPISNMGSVKRYIELFLIAGVVACPSVGVPLLAQAVSDPSLRAQVSGSLCLCAIHVVLRLGGATFEDDGAKKVSNVSPEALSVRNALLPTIIRLCVCHQHLLRLVSQIGFHHIVRAFDLYDQLNPETKAMWNYLEEGGDCVKYRTRHFSTVIFDSAAQMHPDQIFCVQRKETDQWITDAVPAAAFDRIRFVGAELCSVLGAYSPFERYRAYTLSRNLGTQHAFMDLQKLRLIPHARAHHETFLDFAAEMEEVIVEKEDGEEQDQVSHSNMQRKVTPWWSTEVHNELHPRALGIAKRQSVVIVTTLIDKAVNVAGLFRCAEIFAAERVIVSDKKVFEHPHFVATARSAELWMPWGACNEVNLPTFLEGERRRGYCVIGVEQTADSVPLPSFNFLSPECQHGVVFVLGAEGTGIPASLLPSLDHCVEIPQYGLIRSFNVHVSGAIAIYEYSRQKKMRDGICEVQE